MKIERTYFEKNGVSMVEDSIEISCWVRRGEMLVNRSALAFDDSDSYFTIWFNQFGEILPFDCQKQIWGEIVCWSLSEREKIINMLNKEREIVFTEMWG